MNLRMSWIVVCLVLSVIYSFPVSLDSHYGIASGQGQTIDTKVLERGDEKLAVSFNGGKRERARIEIHQIVIQSTI